MATHNNDANEKIRQRNKDSFHDAALYWNKLANERSFEITKQLLGIAFIILPLTGAIVLSDKGISSSNFHLLIWGWVALFVSVISGFYNLWEEATYFKGLSNDSSTREEIWSNSSISITEMNKKTNELGTTDPQSSLLPLILQGLGLLVGVFLIMIVVGSLLWQNVDTKQTNSTHKNIHHNNYMNRK